MTLNKRVDKLVRILLCDVTEYFTAKEALIAAGRIRNRRRDKSNSVQLRAEQMIGKGWLTKIKPESSGLMLIPSEFDNETYLVSVAEFFCTSPHNQVGGNICKHLHLCFLASNQSGHIVPSFETATKNLRHEITRNEMFEIKNAELGEVEITSTVSGQVNYVRLSSNICTCNAVSHHGTCVCIDIARSVCPQVAEMMILEESEVAMNSDNLDQMALSDLDVEIDRDNQVKSDFLDKLDKLRYRYNDEEVPLNIKKLVDEAYDLAFNSFVKKTKKQKNKVLYPNRKQSKHHKPQLCAGVNEIGFNPGNTKQVVRPIIKRKISRKRKTRETAFKVTKTRTKVNKQRKKCIISEKECKQKDFVSLANSSTVPKNVKSYIDKHKKKITIFPFRPDLQILHINVVIEKLVSLYNYFPEDKEEFQKDLIAYISS